MSKLSSVLSAISEKSKAAISAVKSKISKRSAISIAVIALILGSAYGGFELRAKSYYKGCIDGGAMGLIQILPFAAGEIIGDRANIFAGVCGDLRDMTSQGRSLDDLLKAAQDKRKSAPPKQEEQQEQPDQEDSSN
jgi:hypothetical protein